MERKGKGRGLISKERHGRGEAETGIGCERHWQSQAWTGQAMGMKRDVSISNGKARVSWVKNRFGLETPRRGLEWTRTETKSTLFKRKDYANMKTLEVKITFFEGVLGTSSNNKDLYREYIGSKAPDAETVEEEVEAIVDVDAEVEKGITVFPRDEDGRPFLYDYQIKGYLKDTAKMLKKISGTRSSKIKAYRQDIDGLIFPNPRKIPFEFDGDIEICQRPLRASTPMGERIALAASEEIPAGATIECEITCLIDEHVDWLRELLDYGKFRGIGQWRNSGKGRFNWEEIKCY